MALEEKITVDASGALSGVQALNATIASIGESLGRLNTDLGKTKQAFDSLETKLTSTLRSARDAALSLSRAANEATSSVQKAVSGLATIDTALEKRVARVKELRAELQNLSGTALAGGPQGPGSRGGLGGTGGGGGGDGLGQGLARLGDFNRFGDQLTRQFSIIAQSRAFFFLKDQIGEAADGAKELTARIAEIQTITQDASRTTSDWAGTLIKVSNELGRPVTQVADAAYQALSNNVRGAKGQTEDFLLAIGKFANVTRTSLPGAVDSISSVLNSYGLAANQATEVSAKLFKAIELGRFRGEELTNALGKTAPVASQLGISLDQLLSLFVTLTDQGNSLNTASTLTLNLFNSLLKPSAELTKLYASQGVSGGQQFIQVNNGLINVLGLLADKSKGATEEIAKLFPNSRSGRSVIGLTDDLRRLESSFGDIKGSKNAFEIAVQINKESESQVVNEFRESLRNATIGGLGQGLLSLESGFAKIENSIGLITFALKAAGTAGFSVILTQITRFAAQSIIGRNALVALAFLAPNVAAGIAAMASNAFTFAAGLTAGYEVGKRLFGQSQDEVFIIDQFNRKLKERADLSAKIAQGNQVNSFKNIEDGFSRVQQKLAAARVATDAQANSAKEALRLSFETLSGSLTSAVERSRKAIQDIERDISQNFIEINNSRKSAGDFAATAEKSFIGLKLDLATPQQQFRILGDEIDRLKNKGSNLILSGAKLPGNQGEDLLREGRADLQEALSLSNQRVKAFQQTAVLQGQSLTSTQILNVLESEQLPILRTKLAIESQVRSIKQQQIEQEELQKAKEQERIIHLEETIKKFTAIQTKIGEGTINKDKDFLNTSGVFNPAKVQAEISRLGNLIQADLFKIDKAAGARFSVELVDVVQKSQRQIGFAIQSEQEKQSQIQLEQARAAAQKRNSVIRELSNDLQSSLTKDSVDGIAAAVKGLSQLIKNPLGETSNIQSLSDTLFGRKDTAAKGDFVKQLSDIRDLLKEVQSLQPGPDGIIKVPVELQNRLAIVRDGVQKLADATRGVAGLNLTSGTLDTIVNQIESFINTAKGLNAGLTGDRSANTALFNLQGTHGKEFDDSLGNLTTTTNRATETIGKALDALQRKIEDFNNAPLNIIGADDANLPGRSAGGLASLGHGMDNQLHLLRAGETVMNPTATRMFASQIQAMNSFASIPYGSSQNVTVGDVNVFVSDANSSSQTIREIGRGIRREVRRGNLKF